MDIGQERVFFTLSTVKPRASSCDTRVGSRFPPPLKKACDGPMKTALSGGALMRTAAALGLCLLGLIAGCQAGVADPDVGDATNVQCVPADGLASELTAEQAACIAEQDGLPEGIEGYRVSKEHVAAMDRTVWLVLSTIYWEPKPCRRGGKATVIDATSGEVLQRNEWEERC
jgi:hypothetical protein